MTTPERVGLELLFMCQRSQYIVMHLNFLAVGATQRFKPTDLPPGPAHPHLSSWYPDCIASLLEWVSSMATPARKDKRSITSRPRRRWRQFGMRFLLFLLTLVAVVSALLTKPMAVSRWESQIVQQVKDSGGGVMGYSYQEHLLQPHIPSILGDRIYRRISDIQFGVQPPTPELLRSLSSLTHLRKLSFAEATDASIANLPPIESLVELDLFETKVTDASIEVIGLQPNLKTLNCTGTTITKAGLERLTTLLQLETSLVAQQTLQMLLRNPENVITFESNDGKRIESRQAPDDNAKVVAVRFATLPTVGTLESLTTLKDLDTLEIQGVTDEPIRNIYASIGKLSKLKCLRLKIRRNRRNAQFMMFANPAIRSLPKNQVDQLMKDAVAAEKETQAENTDNLAPLGQLSALEILDLEHGFRTSHSYLSKLTNLTHLRLTDIDVKDLNRLEQLTKLNTLNVGILSSGQPTDPSATELIARVTSLEHLTIRMRSLIDGDLQPLAKLDRLKTLAIYRSQVRGPGLEHLKNITTLEKVNIPTLAPSYLKSLQEQMANDHVEVVETKKHTSPLRDDPTEYVRKKARENEKRLRRQLSDGDFAVGREWEQHARIASACRDQGNWADAAESYGDAIEQIAGILDDEKQDEDSGSSFGELHHEMGRTSFLKALVEYDGLESPNKAVKTLELALRPEHSILPVTTEELLRSTRRASSDPGTPNNNPYWYLATNTRMLAYLYQQQGNDRKAHLYWSRYLAIQRATGSGQYRMDPVDYARLRAIALTYDSSDTGATPDGSDDAPKQIRLFLEVDSNSKKFDATACDNASWQVDADGAPFLAIVPPIRQQFEVLAIRLPKGKRLEICCGGAFGSPQSVVLSAKPHPRLESTYGIRVPYPVDAVFARVTPPIRGDETVTLLAKLRTDSGESLPWQDESNRVSPTTEANPFRYQDCWIVAQDGMRDRAFSRPTNEWGTSLIRLADGRLLMAFTSNHIGIPNIEFSTSIDGVHWEEPWSFPHNQSRTTDDALLVTDDDGTIWMVFSTYHNYLNRRNVWCTSSQDGVQWADPKLLEFSRMHTFPIDFYRRPSGEYVIVTNHGVGRGKNPLEIREFQTIEPPSRSDIDGQPRIVFDEKDVCHAVATSGNDILYWNSNDLEIWSPPSVVARSSHKGFQVQPRLILDSRRAALVYRSNNVAVIKLGTLTDVGIEFSEKTTVSKTRWLNPQMLRDGDRWISVTDDLHRKLTELPLSNLWPAKN